MQMRGNTMRMQACVLMLTLYAAQAAAVNGVVGPGNCNEAGFNSVLATVDGSGGGTITFNCGTATIPFTGYKQIANAVTIDGGGTITFDGNNASPLFQVFFSSTTTLKRLTLRRGVLGDVHALENFGTLVLDRVRVIDNVSSESPVMNYGMLTVRSSTFSGNRATSSTLGDGGAIANPSGEVQVSGSTFNGNSAARYGGAIYSEGPLSVTNSTFNANSGSAGGGAVYQTGNGASEIDFSTLVGNTAPYGAGIYNEGSGNASLTISRSILAANTTGNCDGVLLSGGYNLWSGPQNCAFSQPGDAQATLTMGALAANGGPTLTMLPAAGNPAINHVPSAQCPIHVDQRGAGRPFGAGCDSGAVEVGSPIDVIFQDGFD
jgi:predicted outer membrane repeat protein